MSKTFVLLLIDFGILFLGLGELSLRQYPN